MSRSDHGLSLSPDSLLQYEPFVRAVVRSLLSNEDQVQDVVQGTWLKAVDRPPHRGGSTRGWLARVAKNLARDHHRSEGRRRALERSVARKEQSVEVSGAQLAAHRSVVDGVLTLEEPYRTVVLLRYYQGLAPAEIAERLERNPATVRSQLHRAHELLRERLDAEYGGRAAWSALLLPLIGTEVKSAGVSSTVVAKSALWALAAASAIAATAVLSGAFDGERERADLETDGAVAVTVEEATTEGPPRAEVVDERSDGPAGTARQAVANELVATVTLAGEPVADVDVWLLRSADVDAEMIEQNRELYLGIEGVFARFGAEGRTDEAGEVRFDRPAGEAALLAVSPGHVGIVPLGDAAAERVAIALEEVAEVEVRVVDQRGEPLAGVPVQLFGGTTDQNRTPLRWRETAPDGTVRFRDFERGVTWNDPGEPSFRVSLVVPGTRIEAPVARDARWDDEPVTLRLGPTGSVEVRTVTATGELLPLEGRAHVEDPDRRGWNRRSGALRAGRAHFDYVAVGEQLSVSILSPTIGAEWKTVAAGPTRAGETLTIDLVAPGNPVIVGRVLGQDGVPLSSERVFALVRSEERKQLQQVEARTDADGTFRAELSEKVALDANVLVTILTYGVTGWTMRADHAAPVRVVPGELQLGDLVLADAGGPMEGVCLDPAGEPVAGLDVHVAQDYDIGVVARTDEEGRFSFGGQVWAPEVELSIPRSDWVLIEPEVVPRGSTDLTLRVARGGRIEGTVLVDDESALSGMSLYVYPHDAETSGASWSSYGEFEDDGRFVASGLATGRYTCVFRRTGTELARVEDVAVRVAETTRDPRLQNLDLADAVHTVEFGIRTVDGGRLNASVVAVADGKIVGYCNGVRGDERAVLTFPADRPVQVAVRQSGYSPAIFDGADVPAEVVLERGLEVALYTQARPALRLGSSTAHLSFRLAGDDPERSELVGPIAVSGELATEGVAKVLFPEPGRYRLHVSIHTPAGGGTVMAALATPLDVFVEVRGEDAGEGLDVELPESFFERE